jgi:hypothetical protein
MLSTDIFTQADFEVIEDIFNWYRHEDKEFLKSVMATLAASRKLRLAFIQKKTRSEQHAWLHKMLQAPNSRALADHMLQNYLLKGQSSMLVMFCNGLGIEHDGNGSVEGEIQEQFDGQKFTETLDKMVDVFDSRILTIYLICFNQQRPNGWPQITKALSEDQRLKLSSTSH